MIYFIIGVVVGAVACFFVVKNNLKRAEAAWAAAENALEDAKLLAKKL